MGEGHPRSGRFASAAAALWALLALGAPTALAQGEAVPAPAPPSDASAEGVAELEALVRMARFEEAVVRADAVRAALGAADADAARLRVRLEVAAGTALVALERDDAARACFRRALAAEPALDLAPDATSPKVLRVFASVRAEPRAAR